MRVAVLLGMAFWSVVAMAQATTGQAGDGAYSRRNTFAGYVEYANNSGHLFLGSAESRKIGAVGFSYQRRLLHRHLGDVSYLAEVRPAILESDPTMTVAGMFTLPSPSTFTEPTTAVVVCHTGSYSFSGPGFIETQTVTCGRRLAYAQGFSPVGVRLSGLTGHRLQPTFSVLGGYMFSPSQLPTDGSGSFNFSLEFGLGVEFYRTKTTSMRVEYQIQHYSNGDTATNNPGVDSQFLKVTYAFGR